MHNMIGCYNVVEYEHKILLIKEKTKTGFHWALPAGKLEIGESIFACATREGFEESGLRIEPLYLIGVYQIPELKGHNVINFAFCSRLTGEDWQRNILPEAVFVNGEELDVIIETGQLRDFIVAKIISDYRLGRSYSLDIASVLK